MREHWMMKKEVEGTWVLQGENRAKVGREKDRENWGKRTPASGRLGSGAGHSSSREELSYWSTGCLLTELLLTGQPFKKRFELRIG